MKSETGATKKKKKKTKKNLGTSVERKLRCGKAAEREREREEKKPDSSLVGNSEGANRGNKTASERASERGRHNPPKIDIDQDKRPEIYDIFYCELDIV